MNIFEGMMKLWIFFFLGGGGGGFITNLDYFLGPFLSLYEYSVDQNLIIIRGE